MQMKVTPLNNRETLVTILCYILQLRGALEGSIHPQVKEIRAKLLRVPL